MVYDRVFSVVLVIEVFSLFHEYIKGYVNKSHSLSFTQL